LISSLTTSRKLRSSLNQRTPLLKARRETKVPRREERREGTKEERRAASQRRRRARSRKPPPSNELRIELE
jgi:hypothetical protein